MRRVLVPTLVLAAACNKAPEGLVVTVGPEGARTTDTLDLDVVTAAVDPNKRDQVGMSVAWFQDGVEQVDLADSWRVPAPRTAKGQIWTAEVVATDSVLDAEPAIATIAILNSLPTLTVSLATKAPHSDDDLVASVTTVDADGDPVEIAWSWTVDGSDAGVSGESVPWDQTARGQTWVVTAVPSDDEAAGEAQSVDVTVRNSVPSVLAARTDPTSLREDTVARCVGAGWEDADPEDPETYEITWLVNGGVVSTEPTLDGSDFDRSDEVSCILTPADNESLGDPVQSSPVRVRNTGPEVIGVALSPADPRTDDDLEATLTGFEDIDGDDAVAIYAWFVDGVEVSDASFLRSTAFEKGQEVFVRVTGYDGLDLGAPRFGVATIANTPPTAPAASLPPTAADGDNLVCEVAVGSEDADGDRVEYAVTWTVDGVAFTGGSFTTTWPGDTIPASLTAPGESWGCTIIPNDGDEVGPTGASTTTISHD